MASIHYFGTNILSLMLLIPFVGAIVVLLVPQSRLSLARTLAGLAGLLVFIGSVLLAVHMVRGEDGFQFAERLEWIPALGISYTVGVDGLSIWLVVLTALLTFLVLLASGNVRDRSRAYLACLLFLEAGMLGTFVALDGLTFYVFWELMLIPMYFLIGVWGGTRRVYAAIKFIIFTAAGSLLMLVAIIYLACLHEQQFGQLSFFLVDWTKLNLSHAEELLLFSAFALAFAIKIPIFPLHTWLPDAHVEAPTGGSVLLAGVLLKMGLYGLLRFGIPVFPHATVACSPIFAGLGVFGIIFGALVAWVQTDMKKLVAYSSVSHMGFCVLGYATLSVTGLQGCVLQMINHGVSTGALFFVVGVLYERKHTRLIADYGGLAAKLPCFAVVYLIFTLSSIALPLTNGFVGEFLILLAGVNYQPLIGAIAVSGMILGAVYMLSLYRRVCFGPLNRALYGDMEDLRPMEIAVFLPLILLVFIIGIYPQPALRMIEPAARQMSAVSRGAAVVAGEVREDRLPGTGEFGVFAGDQESGRHP